MVKKRKLTLNGPPHQGILEAALSNIFPTQDVTNNVKKKLSIKNPPTGWYLEVDVWYADLRLCFEYQDEHHYQPSWYSHIPLDVWKEKDEIKRTKLVQKGETLIEVPCWWDGTAESLRATINFYRPDLIQLQLHMHSVIIPANPPLKFFSADASSPGDTQLMLASFPISSEIEEMTGYNPWWLGEKYDGVRCFWNPEEKHLYSRNKQVIGVHPAVNKRFGDIALDGEIWCGRGHFNESLISFSASLDKVEWALFKVVCFDEVSQHMREQTFEARYWLILSHPPDHPVVIIASRFLCWSATALMNSLQQVIDGGGEGIILRRPHSLYRPGRSLDLVKFKGSRSDQEALVVDVEEDGALLLQLPNGTTFAVAKADCELPRRAVRGDVVTFTHDFLRRSGTHDILGQDNMQMQWTQQGAQTRTTMQQEAARGLPANIVVHRIRTDVIWEDVVSTAGHPVRQFHNESYQRIDDTAKPNSPQAAHNRRELLENFARSKGCDPLLPHFWYNLNPTELIYVKGATACSQHYAETIVHLFPELHLDITKLKQQQSWKTEANRRTFFDKYAASKGMDPRNPDFWSRVTVQELRRFQPGFITIAEYHGGKLSTCLMQLYPDIGLTRSHFDTVQSWKTEAERKSFFDKFAASKGMDPRNPDFWGSVAVQELCEFQPGYRAIAGYYGGRLSTCLMQLYPDIGLKPSHFDLVQSWKTEADRRGFFDNYAASKGMDPRNPDFWSRVTVRDLYRYQPGFATIFRYHGGRLSTCLMQLYPDIGLKHYHFNPAMNAIRHDTHPQLKLSQPSSLE